MMVRAKDRRNKNPDKSSACASTNSQFHNNSSGDSRPKWRGSPIKEINHHLDPYKLDHSGIVEPTPTPTHTVLHEYPIQESDNVPPRPHKAPHKWDIHHVRLPCAPECEFTIENDDGTTQTCPRWAKIEEALLQPINTSQELQEAILTYCNKRNYKYKFDALHQLLASDLSEEFFGDLLPRIIRLALRLPQLVQAPIPLLQQGQNASVTLTQEQISCLLANAFLCTFPYRDFTASEYVNYSEINFNRLFEAKHSHRPTEVGKLKCILNYFRRVCPTDATDASNVPNGCVTFIRRHCQLDELPDWSKIDAKLGDIPLHISSTGTIEDQGIGLLQVDFANKFLGGGVLGGGCVQEEIRFVICPELIVSKLFIQCLLPTEAVVIIGCERYSDYTGYGSTFEWAGNHEDQTPRDNSRRRMTAIVAIDALRLGPRIEQFNEELMLRELNKAFAGYVHTLPPPVPGVATGNWGCGAFGGDPHLKTLLQLMVCATVGRPMAYFTFGNEELRDSIYDMYQLFKAKETTVQRLWLLLQRYKYKKNGPKLYEFLTRKLNNEVKVLGCSCEGS